MKTTIAKLDWLLLLTFLVLSSAVPSGAQQFDPELAETLQSLLDTERENGDLTGMSVAVISPEHGTWTGTSGWSRPAESDTITSDMLFGIGSVTKTYVSVLIQQLVEEGVLTLEDSLHKWLPPYANIDVT